MPLILLLLGLLTSPVVSAAPAAQGDATPRREALAALEARIAKLRRQMDATAGDKKTASTLLRDVEQRVGRLARELRVLDADLERQRRRVEGLHARALQHRAALQRQRDALARQVRAAYVMGRQAPLETLLNQQDPAAVGRIMTYHDYLARARSARIAETRRQAARLEATEAEARAAQQALARMQQTRAADLAELQRAREQRREVVASLNAELADQGNRIARLEADARRLETLLGGLETALADIPVDDPQRAGFAGRKGRLPWPASGRLVTPFGAPRLGGLAWDGVMIAAPDGGEVRAVHHGRVAFADWLRGFGLLLILDHGAGYMTLYGHNEGLLKEVGDWVEANEPVALVGNSGGRRDAGVYFAIRHQGRSIDPADWCRTAG